MSPDEKLLTAIFGTEGQKELLKEENDFAKEWQEAKEICRLAAEWNPELAWKPALVFGDSPRAIAHSKDGVAWMAEWFDRVNKEVCLYNPDAYTLSKVICE